MSDEQHVHIWHHNGCYHMPVIGDINCVCGHSEPGYNCDGNDDGSDCIVVRVTLPDTAR